MNETPPITEDDFESQLKAFEAAVDAGPRDDARPAGRDVPSSPHTRPEPGSPPLGAATNGAPTPQHAGEREWRLVTEMTPYELGVPSFEHVPLQQDRLFSDEEIGFEEIDFEPPEETERTRRPTGATAPRWLWQVLVAGALITIIAVGANALWQSGAITGPAGAFADLWRDWNTSLQDEAASIVGERVDAQRRLPGSDSLLNSVVDADDAVVSVALLAATPEGLTTVALLPPGLFEILPGFGDFALSDAAAFGGPGLISLTVSNALGVRIDAGLVLRPGEIAAAVSDPVEIDLLAPLLVSDGTTSSEVVPEGTNSHSAETAEMLLVTQGASGQLDWLRRQAAVWDGVLGAMADDPAVVERFGSYAGTDRSEAIGLLADLAASDNQQITVVPVTRVNAQGAAEGFKLDRGAVDEFVARRLGHLQYRADRPRVEILNGNGRALTTRAVAQILVQRGFHVVKTDNADTFEYKETLVIAQGREHRGEAQEAVELLKTGEVLLELRAPSGVVDVSIIVGSDIPAGEG